MKTIKELLGARIKELRKLQKLSQERLAEMVGVEPRHMSRIEGGRSYPSLDRLVRISEALATPLKEFFEFGHLENNADRIVDIAAMVKEMKEEQQQFVYKMVKMIK